MTSGVILAGLGLAVIGFAGISFFSRPNKFTGFITGLIRRYAARYGKVASEALLKQIPMSANSKYYKGGFEQKMSKREASLVLGVSPSATKTKIKDAHKRVMLANHPDRGGSPYIAAKINEAKDLLDKS